MPLQLFFADLHEEVPLQEFTPVQCTVALSAATETLANPEVNNIAAAAAIAALDTLLICILDSPHLLLKRSEIAAWVQDPANEGIITYLPKLITCPRRPLILRGFFRSRKCALRLEWADVLTEHLLAGARRNL